MTRDEAIWLAGLFDAGGGAKAFRASVGRRRPGGYRWIFNVWFSSAEVAVMHEIKAVVGGGTVYSPKPRGKLPNSRRNAFQRATKRTRPARSSRYLAYADVARELVRKIRPYTRIRGARIDEALKVDIAAVRLGLRHPR